MPLRSEALEAMETAQKRASAALIQAELPDDHPYKHAVFNPEHSAILGFTEEALDGLLGWLEENADRFKGPGRKWDSALTAMVIHHAVMRLREAE